MKVQKNHSNSIDNKSGVIAILIVLLIGAAVVIWVINSMNASQPDTSSQNNTDVAAINSCLDSAWTTLQKQWPEGEEKDIHTGHRLTMTYYNDQLDCYARYNQDGTYDTDIQRLESKKNDELASYQTQSQENIQHQTNRMTCTSSAIGSTAFTNCY